MHRSRGDLNESNKTIIDRKNECAENGWTFGTLEEDATRATFEGFSSQERGVGQ